MTADERAEEIRRRLRAVELWPDRVTFMEGTPATVREVLSHAPEDLFWLLSELARTRAALNEARAGRSASQRLLESLSSRPKETRP